MEIGIIGLPNVGKSTLFNALTKLSVSAENFPFTTIDPNVGIVQVPDARLEKLGEVFRPERLTRASIKFIDIAGLVRGASKGEGLGNKFLSHIRETDAVVHVIRGFGSETVVNVLGKAKPEEEKAIITTELVLSDLEQATRLKEKAAGAAKSGEKEAKEKLHALEQLVEGFNKGVPAREQAVAREKIRDYQFLTAKPVLYVLNVDENTRAEDSEGQIVLCAKLEAELAQLSGEEQETFRKEMGGAESGLDKLITAGQKLLNLMTFYTVVGTEVRAWHAKAGSSVIECAGKIHTDMAKGFIRADVYSFNELEKHGSEKALHEKGLVRSEGRDYVVKDGDILKIHFRS